MYEDHRRQATPKGLYTKNLVPRTDRQEVHMGNPSPFTERELDVMSVLWRLGSGTVAEVREGLPAPLGYTSVLKMLQILEEKGMVRHEQEGRAYRYHPLVEPREAGGHALRRIVDTIFQGSAELAVAQLVSQESLAPEEVARLRALLDGLEGREAEGAGASRGGDAEARPPSGEGGRARRGAADPPGTGDA
jgi:predicted transcriptional regulator